MSLISSLSQISWAKTDAGSLVHETACRHSMLTFAGVMRIGGRYVGPDDYNLAAKTIRKWCTTDAAVEAAKLVTEYLVNRVTVRGFRASSRQRRREAGLTFASVLQIADLDTGWTASKGMYAPWSIYLASVRQLEVQSRRSGTDCARRCCSLQSGPSSHSAGRRQALHHNPKTQASYEVSILTRKSLQRTHPVLLLFRSPSLFSAPCRPHGILPTCRHFFRAPPDS